MATGPEHYRAAERCMAATERTADANQGRCVTEHESAMLRADIAATLAAAQVHATLALAAATATENGADVFYNPDWAQVLNS